MNETNTSSQVTEFQNYEVKNRVACIPLWNFGTFPIWNFLTILTFCAMFLLSCSKTDYADPSSLTGHFRVDEVGASSSSAAAFSSATNTHACTYNTADSTLKCTEQTYKTVVISTQTWMAENLNYNPTTGNSWCYNSLDSNCTIYGRLYDYAAAMIVCPTGWHLPDTTEWNTLEAYVGGNDTATTGNKLKARSLWATHSGITNTDDYGFSALPGGDYYGGSFNVVDSGGYWWTATPNGTTSAYGRCMGYDLANVRHLSNDLTRGFSVRCLKDD